MSKSLEKLSSGLRINRAGDDAAGLVISENLRSQIGGLKQAVRNAQDGISVVQTAEGALTEVHAMLQRMRDLAVQASNTGSNGATAIAAAQAEVDQLVSAIGDIAEPDEVQRHLAARRPAALTFQVGANSGETLSVTLKAWASARWASARSRWRVAGVLGDHRPGLRHQHRCPPSVARSVRRRTASSTPSPTCR